MLVLCLNYGGGHAANNSNINIKILILEFIIIRKCCVICNCSDGQIMKGKTSQILENGMLNMLGLQFISCNRQFILPQWALQLVDQYLPR